jgi:alpha-L-rhamnosidase
MSRQIKLLSAMFSLNILLGSGVETAQRNAAALTPVNLRCEYAVNPLGIDTPNPRFSWLLESTLRGQVQSAYQILVASSEAKLKSNVGDLWDSGKVASDQNIHVIYSGTALNSRQRLYWKVRVWDRDGEQSTNSAPAFFETGLLHPSDWRAKWITTTAQSDNDRSPLAKAKWIYVQNEIPVAQYQKLQLWRSITIPEGVSVRRAEMHYAADIRDRERGTNLFVNGKLDPSLWRSARRLKSPSIFNLRSAVKPGTNSVAVETAYAPGRGFIGLINIELDNGQAIEIGTDSRWKARVSESRENWKESDLEGPGWQASREVAKFGEVIGGYEVYKQIDKLVPPPYVRKSFELNKRVRSARVYASATGVYELWLNGRRVGRDVFAPGWTDYAQRIQYQTYDVSELLRRGRNAIGGLVGDGWYSGHNGLFNVNPNHYGFDKSFLCQLHVDYSDGTSEVIGSDGTWRATTGPIRYSDMFMGEIYDARREIPGWDQAEFDDSSWQLAVIANPPVGALTAQADPPVRQTMELPAMKMFQPKPGTFVFDLGQNMVGWVRLRVQGKSSDRVMIRYGETVNLDGTLFTENLRTAISTDYYSLKGGGPEVYEPHFTFHGFRYVELTGYPGTPAQDAITGIVLRSDLRTSGNFECSNAMLNRLQSNIVWGQRGNFLSVPTDCPQRDERDGWTGDIQAFARTATFNMDSAAFLSKWLIDLEHGQDAEGSLPDIAPTTASFGRGKFGWGDAGVMVPWTLYQVYDDKRMIEQRYQMMRRWVEFLRGKAKDYLAPTDSYGDWVSPKPEAPKDVLSTAYFARVTWQLSKMAAVIGETEAAKQYEDLFQQIKAAFNRAYVSEDAKIKSDTQSVYVVALRFNLLPGDRRAIAAKHLVAAIERANWHVGTGFLGAANLLPALSDAGHIDIAYRLLTNETYPSWGFTIKGGATTIWERWDGFDPEKGPSNMGNMNSYNHYAFGAVGEWMYANIAGIDTDPAKPGFKHIIIRPRPGGEITWAKGEYDSVRGRISTSWRLRDGQFELQVSIPANTTATVYIPASARDKVTESGKSADKAEGVNFVGMSGATAVYEVGSGSYRFTSPR